MQDGSGVLLLGVVGERIVNHYSFLAAFVSDEEFSVVCEGKPLGTLPLDRPLVVGSFLIFAGRRWRVTVCSPEDKRIDVVPAKGGKLPLFEGMHGKVHDRVRQEMREVLRSNEPVPFLDATAVAMLGEARDAYRRLCLDTCSVIELGSEVLVFTWRGDWVNDTLALMLSGKELRATNEGLCLSVLDARTDRVVDALSDIESMPPPTDEALVSHVTNKYIGKWDSLLPESLLDRNYASSEIDVAAAIGTARDIIAVSV
jgi:ATP-dependent Lhr-like helicase